MIFTYKFTDVEHGILTDFFVRSDQSSRDPDNIRDMPIENMEPEMFGTNKDLMMYFIHQGKVYRWMEGMSD